MSQIIKSEKTISDREYILYGVDAEICCSILSSNSMDSLLEHDELENYLYLCFGDGHHTNINKAQEFINLLLLRVLGFDCSSLNGLLSEYEQIGKFHKTYRDHLSHQLRVYLLGLYLYINNEYIHERLLNDYKTEEEVLRIWTVTALTHDWGYVFEWGNPSLLDHDSESLNVLNEYLSDPIKMFFPDVKNRFLPKQKENMLKNASINRGTITNFSNIQKDEEVVKSFKTVEEYANKTNLGEQGNSLQKYYSFMRKYIIDKREDSFCDHGIVSAYILIWLSTQNFYYNQAISHNIYSDDVATEHISNANKTLNTAISAASAIALHNIRKFSEDIQNRAYDEQQLTLHNYIIDITETPLAYLLVLADSIQEWERPSFLAQDDRDFQAQDMHILAKGSVIYLCFPTDSLAMRGTEGSRFEKIKTSIDSLLVSSSNEILLQEVEMNDLIEMLKKTDMKRLLRTSIVGEYLPPTQLYDPSYVIINKAFDLYRTGRRYANEANFEMAINIQRKAAEEFKKVNQPSWQSRSLGRVAFSSLYFGVPEEQVSKDLQLACELDIWQGTGNYYWIIDHCLKSNTTRETKNFYFSTLLEQLNELKCINLKKYYLSTSENERYKLFRSALVLFFDQLIKRERDAQWPNWAMSDLPRLYLLRAEEKAADNLDSSIAYLSMAEKTFCEMELTSYAAWTHCKRCLLSIKPYKETRTNAAIEEVINSLQDILLNGRKILQSPRKERDLIKFFSTIIEFYYILLRYSHSLSDSFDECSYILKGIQTSDIYGREEYLQVCETLLEKAQVIQNKSILTRKILGSLDRFKERLVWIETQKIIELIYVHMMD